MKKALIAYCVTFSVAVSSIKILMSYSYSSGLIKCDRRSKTF